MGTTSIKRPANGTWLYFYSTTHTAGELRRGIDLMDRTVEVIRERPEGEILYVTDKLLVKVEQRGDRLMIIIHPDLLETA